MVVILIDFYKLFDLCRSIGGYNIGLIDDPREFTWHFLALYLQFDGVLIDLINAAHVTVGVKHACFRDGPGDQRNGDGIFLEFLILLIAMFEQKDE